MWGWVIVVWWFNKSKNEIIKFNKMETAQFLKCIKEELEFEEDLNLVTNLNELDEWDSMSAMVLIGYVSEKYGITLTGDQLKKFNSVEALIAFIGTDKFE